MLLEAGCSGAAAISALRNRRTANLVCREPARRLDHGAVDRVSLQLRNYSAWPGKDTDRYIERFSVSYVTGSHAFKGGFQLQQGVKTQGTQLNDDIYYNFLRGFRTRSPSLRRRMTPINRTKADLGVFVQDRWTMNRLALNMGLRFDYFNGYVPPSICRRAIRVDPRAQFRAVTRVPEWTDLNPRVGASYDLFGNGRTALKASLGRYVGQKRDRRRRRTTRSPRRSTASASVGGSQPELTPRIAIWATSATTASAGRSRIKLRQEQSPRDSLCRRRDSGIRRPRLLVGFHRRIATSDRFEDISDGGV